ncbi:MAG: DUF2922 domain-containing protein [Peptoniphilaceae bacterium]
METKTSLELSFKDENNRSLSFSILDPKDNIEKQDLINLEQNIVDNEVFLGPSGKIKGFGSAKLKEVKTTDLLEG